MSELESPLLKHIYEPIKIGHLELPNKIAMGPVCTGLEYEKDFSQLANFYRQRAKGGVSLITVGGFAFNFLGALRSNQPRFNQSSQVEDHQIITNAVHAEGSYVLFNLVHYGAESKHVFAMNSCTVKEEDGDHIAWKMPRRIIQKTIRQYVDTALLAKAANYDGVEIDISRHRLLNSFATSGLNPRRDEWGGTSQARQKMSIEVVKRIREQAGTDFVIGARISLLDFHRFGKSWEETIAFAHHLQEVGVNYFCFDFGVGYMAIPVNHGLTPEEAWVPFIEQFKKQISVPVAFGDNLSSPKLVDDILGRNPDTFAELTRPLIVDPSWVKKIAYKLERNIIECTKCNQGCSPLSVTKNTPLHCMMNPLIFDEHPALFTPTKNPRRILVVGAGPSGLATAVFAARRGHKVTIFEEREQVGGQVSFCSKVPGKTQFASLITLFQRLCERFDVTVETGHKVTISEIEELQHNFDEIILATGSKPDSIDIQGTPPSKIYQYQDIFVNPTVPVGQRVAVLGCNRIAIDTAIYLVDRDSRKLSQNEWLESWGIGDPKKHIAGVVGVIPKVKVPDRQVSLLTADNKDYTENFLDEWKQFETRWLRIMGIRTYTNVNYETYESDALKITIGKHHTDEQSVSADHIIVCTLPKPNDLLANAMKRSGIPFTKVGSLKPQKSEDIKSIWECVREGVVLGCKL